MKKEYKFDNVDIEKLADKKFVDFTAVSDYEVWTDSGFKDIKGINTTIPYKIWILKTYSYTLECADNHIVYWQNPETNLIEQIFVRELQEGDAVLTVTGLERILKVTKTSHTETMYDLVLDDEGHRYYTDGILSHNSTLYTIFSLWYCFFNPHKKILFAANKESTVKELLQRVKFGYTCLPKFLQMGVTNWSAKNITFENGSSICICACSADAARGQSVDVVILDEAAFIPPNIMDEFVSSVFPTIASRPSGKVIAVSTPNGTSNWFAETWHKAIYKVASDDKQGNTAAKDEDELVWKPVNFPWWEHPLRDEKWKKKQLAMLQSERRFNAEFACQFIGSSNTLFEPKTIECFKKDVMEANNKSDLYTTDNIEGYDFQVYKTPISGHTYAMGIDIADGSGGDSSTILIADVTDLTKSEIVLSFGSNTISTQMFTYIVARLGARYNTALIAGERNGIGSGVFDLLNNVFEYPNLVFFVNKLKPGDKPGIFSTHENKLQACLWAKNFANACTEDFAPLSIKLNVLKLVYEIEGFEQKRLGNSVTYSACTNKHDDYVMALVWLLFTLSDAMSDLYYNIRQNFTTSFGANYPIIIEPGILPNDYIREADIVNKFNTSISNKPDVVLEQQQVDFEQQREDFYKTLDTGNGDDFEETW